MIVKAKREEKQSRRTQNLRLFFVVDLDSIRLATLANVNGAKMVVSRKFAKSLAHFFC